MTGVSRFGELRPNWTYVGVGRGSRTKGEELSDCHVTLLRYSKEEGLMPAPGQTTPPEKLLGFTFLLISAGDFPIFSSTHSIVERSEGFQGLSLNWRDFPPVKITLGEAIYVLVRNTDLNTCRMQAKQENCKFCGLLCPSVTLCGRGKPL